ncbi:MAG TPA: thioredoxin family protein [Ferruginibacter sp.]|nr:thioredoxin family protein [Ferruginibacter sp.]HRE63550.1 thioredoxin family protein [Ferruginibacter sp.]
MKKLFFISVLLFAFVMANAQKTSLYNPGDDAEKEIEYALMVAKSKNKHVLIQAGGNWCKWCIEFDRFSKTDSSIKEIIGNNYVVYHLNWSKENENKKTFAKYGFPQRFGFPVFIILNAKGEKIHTQESGTLEDGKSSYNSQKVNYFLEMWTPKMLSPASYGM